MKLNKEMLSALAADYALPYRELANQIGLIAAQKSTLANGVNEANFGLWDGFKKGLDVAIAADHSPTAIRVGFAVACEEAGIPAGSFRSYVATIGNMYADIQAGSLEREVALLMKVKEARERYQDADKKALREAKARLEAATKGWTVAQLDELSEYAGLVNEERKAQADAALEALAQERQAAAA
jgi:hypothetical protein